MHFSRFMMSGLDFLPPGVLKTSDGGPLVPQLAPNPDNISLALIMRKYHANPASIKRKCYSFTIIMNPPPPHPQDS